MPGYDDARVYTNLATGAVIATNALAIKIRVHKVVLSQDAGSGVMTADLRDGTSVTTTAKIHMVCAGAEQEVQQNFDPPVPFDTGNVLAQVSGSAALRVYYTLL